MKKRIKKINIIFCIFCIFFVSCADENITKESVVEVFFTPTAIASSKVQLIPSPSPKTIPKKESSPILEKSKIKAESSTPYNSKKERLQQRFYTTNATKNNTRCSVTE